MNISAIDVGSNAMRMVIGEVDEAWQVRAIENIRLLVNWAFQKRKSQFREVSGVDIEMD